MGRKRVYSLSEDQLARKRQKAQHAKAVACTAVVVDDDEPSDYHNMRIRSFREMCQRHEGFITASSAIDGYLLALASLYLKRAGLSAEGYKKDRYFFYALYLAIETEEDLPRGAEEILLYLLGPAPSGLLGRRTLQIEWDRRLTNFLTGKDKVPESKDEGLIGNKMSNVTLLVPMNLQFWAKLDYRTWISEAKCRREMDRFPKHDALIRKQRTQEQMHDW